ncbi:MAG TPA: PfkB family carbohydrate kinase [Kofleriaceae bacterium]|nr:PfkB family carbohydrate kinase [Kofleriaceae bacterium]
MADVVSVALIAGLDPSGGAGLIADVRVVAAHDMRPIGVITALTEQDTGSVRAVHPVPAEVVGDQLTALLSDVPVQAVKIGLLGDPAIAEQVARALDLVAAPVVWDPVLLPGAGRVPLFTGDPRAAARLLRRHVTVATPNLAEAGALLGRPVTDVDEARAAAAALVGVAGAAVVVTGGHLPGHAVDLLATPDGVIEIAGARIGEAGAVHGTGCAYSTALACALAGGAALEAAARLAKEYVAARLGAPVRAGRGRASVL